MKRISICAATLGLVVLSPVAAQQGRPQIRLDDPLVGLTPDGFDLHLASEGDLWVATWVDERDPVSTFDDDIYMAVSTDGGKTWAPEQAVTTGAALAIDTDDNWLTVDNGIIYVSYDDDAISGQAQSIVLYSTDLGVSWTTVAYTADIQNPRVFADGDNVLVLMYDDFATPNPLWADFSTTGPAGLNVNPLTAVNNLGADCDFDSYDATVLGGTGYITFFDDFNLVGDDDLWYVSLDFASGVFSAPLQVNSSVHDVDTRPLVRVAGGKVHFNWYADDNIGGTSTVDDVVHYRSLDLGSGLLGTELVVSSLLDDCDYFHMDAEGSNVLLAFSDDSSGDDHPTAMVSNDGGTTFATVDLPQFVGGPLDAQWFGCGVRGDYMFVIAEDDSFNLASIDEVPTFWYSNDSGTTWYGPFLLGQDFETDEDIDTEYTAWNFTAQGMAGVWQTDGGSANPDALMFGAIDFPYAELTYAPGSATFSQVGNPVSAAGDFARWGLSTALGTQIHPENPALTVGLGASPAYSFTTSLPPIPPITSVVGGDGSAVKALPVNIPPGTYYLQAWTNSGSIVGGSLAGEIFTITL